MLESLGSVKLLFIASKLLWLVFEYASFIYAKPSAITLFFRNVLRGLSLVSLILTIILLSSNQEALPLLSTAQMFLSLALLLELEAFVFFLLESFQKRSLGIVFSPVLIFIALLGIAFFDAPISAANEFTIAHQIAELGLLFVACNSLYAFFTAFIYAQVFQELRIKKSVFLASRLPNLGTLRNKLLALLLISSFLLFCIIIANFYLIPIGWLPLSLASARTLLPSCIAWLGISALAILCLMKRIPVEKTYLYLGIALIFIFWNILL